MKASEGFTLFEFLVVVTFISLLGAVLLERLWRYQEHAEKAAMEQMVGALRSALRLKIAEYLPKGRASLLQLVSANPMDWLDEKPANYVGDRYGTAPVSVPAGSWYFDLRDKSLVYKVAGRHFMADHNGQKEVRYQVRAVSDINAKDGDDIADKQSINGVTLVSLGSYRWF